MDNKFTQKAENALINSLRSAESLGHTYIGTEHLLLALAEDKTSCSALILNRNAINSEKLTAMIKDYSGTGVRSTLAPSDMTPRAKSILEESYNLALRYDSGIIGTEHMLLAILLENDSVAIKLLKKAKADLSSMKEEIYGLLKTREKHINGFKKDMSTPLLKQYGRNLCEMAKEELFDPVIARDIETDRVIRILSRKTKNNPCLIGEAGVGKTAIVEGLATRIVRGEVPPALIGKSIISVDLTSMVAGAKYRGDFEDRIKGIIAETVKNKNIILFVDEIHTIVGAGAAEGAIDASNILKPQLARGDLKLIGATTIAEYHKYIERDSALERRFQPIIINEPSKTTAIKMLSALKNGYEKHHRVVIEKEAIEDCVHLASRYINDRFLPDKAIDVLDEACVIASNRRNDDIITEQNSNTRNLKKSVCDNIIDAYYNEHLISGNLYSKENLPHVRSNEVRSAISEICGIPLKMIKKDIDYSEISERINQKLPGRENIVNLIVNTIKKQDLGFSAADRPRGIFMFIGESGTGKTAMALELSKTLFFGNSRLLRYDMSEFSEKHSISKLIGSPPGYVGHDEGGCLTEGVRKNPHSLILFDEIEKADREVLNILLQIADYGYLKDSQGKPVDFKNTVIVMTSNLGARNNSEISHVGFIEGLHNEGKRNVLSALRKHYTSEFLNRFDEIVYFEPINLEFLNKIAENRITEFVQKAADFGHMIKICPEISSVIAKKSILSPGGIRALLKNISKYIEAPIIEIIAKANNNEKKHISVSICDENIEVREITPAVLS